MNDWGSDSKLLPLTDIEWQWMLFQMRNGYINASLQSWHLLCFHQAVIVKPTWPRPSGCYSKAHMTWAVNKRRAEAEKALQGGTLVKWVVLEGVGLWVVFGHDTWYQVTRATGRPATRHRARPDGRRRVNISVSRAVGAAVMAFKLPCLWPNIACPFGKHARPAINIGPRCRVYEARRAANRAREAVRKKGDP